MDLNVLEDKKRRLTYGPVGKDGKMENLTMKKERLRICVKIKINGKNI